MNEALTWGAIIMAGTSILAMVKFWIDIGKAWEKLDSNAAERALITTKIELLTTTIAEFKVTTAQTYATTRALTETEVNLASGLRDAVQGVYSRLDAVNSRLDSLVTIAAKGPHQ